MEGTPNIMVNIAKCCMPIKGDDIIGYITKDKGISIHKKTCQNIPLNKERIVNVSWNLSSTNYYYTNIYVTVNDETENLVNIITEIGKKGSLVKSCNTKEIDNKTVHILNIRIKDKDELESIMKSIRKIHNVTSVKEELRK